MENIIEPAIEDFDIPAGDLASSDPFIKEFYAFCRINGMEERAIKLLEKKIKEKKQLSS